MKSTPKTKKPSLRFSSCEKSLPYIVGNPDGIRALETSLDGSENMRLSLWIDGDGDRFVTFTGGGSSRYNPKRGDNLSFKWEIHCAPSSIAWMVNRFSSDFRTRTGSRNTRFPILIDGKYLCAFHSLNVRKLGLVASSGNTRAIAVFIPTSDGS